MRSLLELQALLDFFVNRMGIAVRAKLFQL